MISNGYCGNQKCQMMSSTKGSRGSEDGTLNLPELEGDWVISGSRPRILQMEKSVRDLLETEAKDGLPTGT